NHIEQCNADLAKHVSLGIDAFVNTRCRIDQPVEHAVPEGAKIKFNRLDLTLHFPYVMYLSFSLDQKGVENNGQEAASENKQQLEYHLVGYSFVIVRKDTMSTVTNTTNSHIVAAETYSAKHGAIEHFFTRAFYWAKELLTIIRNTNNILLPTVEQLLEFEGITNCEYCNAEFTNSGNATRKFSHRVPWDYQSWDENMIGVVSTSGDEIYEDRGIQNSESKPILKTLHHNHFGNTVAGGRIEAVICQYCNLRILSKTYLPILIHSPKGLDFRLIITGLGTSLYSASGIRVIAKSPKDIIQVEIASDVLFIPKICPKSGLDWDKVKSNMQNPHFTKRSQKARIRFTNTMN
ncbi:unnamed protein product, partial [Allacma fusca]